MEIFLPVFEALNEANVRYLVAGGLATVLHGYQRLTGDIDLILDLNSENCIRAMQVLDRLKFKPRPPVALQDFADPSKRESWVRDKDLKVFSAYATAGIPFDIDIFVTEPKPFSELERTAVEIVIDNISIPILSIPELIALKKIANRPKDLEDICALEIILHDKE